MGKGIYSAIFIFTALFLSAYSVHKGNDGLGFCVSCHLSPSERLHDPMFKDFVAAEPTDLAGHHYQKGEAFTCLSCHQGDSFQGEFQNDFSAFLNLGKYLTGRFDPNEKLRYPLEDSLCQGCHALSASQGKADRFHGLSAHKQPFTVNCISCHSAHEKGEMKNFFMNYGNAVKICKKCHLDITSGKFGRIIAE